jgi:hypothetical protein
MQFRQPSWQMATPAPRLRCPRVPKLGEGLTGAAAGCAADLDRVRDQVFLARKYRFARHVLESFHGHYTGGQQLSDHPGSTFFGIGGLPRLLHSRG